MLNFNFLTMIYYLQIDLLLFVQGQLNNVRKLMAFEVTSCKCFFSVYKDRDAVFRKPRKITFESKILRTLVTVRKKLSSYSLCVKLKG